MCAKFEAAVQMVHDARADHVAACAAVTAAETEHGLDSPEAEHAIKGPQHAAVGAEMAAEEALAHTPATTAQEALQKAYLLIEAAVPDEAIKAIKEDIARFLNGSPTLASHRHYQFGTFEERLKHASMVFESEPPEVEYEDGHPGMSDAMLAWIKDHEISIDWLYAGTPSPMMIELSRARKNTPPREAMEEIHSLMLNFENCDEPMYALTAILRILGQMADHEAFDKNTLGMNEAMAWLSNQGMDELNRMDAMAHKVRQLAAQP